MSFNKVILIGNMCADPEVKQTTTGLAVCSFSIAVNRKFAKDNEQSCDFINIVTWRQQAEFVGKYFKKGKPILVCGQIQTRNYTDNGGVKRYVTEILADEVSFVGSNENSTEAKNQAPVITPHNPTSNQPQFETIPDSDDLPFQWGCGYGL